MSNHLADRDEGPEIVNPYPPKNEADGPEKDKRASRESIEIIGNFNEGECFHARQAP